MDIFIERDNKIVKLAKSSKSRTGSELLKELKINPHTVILVKNDEVVLLEEEFEDSDAVKILSVVSGG